MPFDNTYLNGNNAVITIYNQLLVIAEQEEGPCREALIDTLLIYTEKHLPVSE